jgi:undecaprenyl diphosphate synthase
MDAQRQDRIPHHVAVIMDGNGRWAERQGMERTEGHRAGVESVRQIVRAANDLGIGWLTLYAFSSENWNRPKGEVEVLMSLPEEYFQQELPEAIEKNVRILSIGRSDRLPPGVRSSLGEAEAKTAENTGMRLVFALSYGARGEIVDAVKRLMKDGRVDPESIDEKTFGAYLDQPDMPDVDLLIRTGAEQRVSNFLLWQIAYAEIVISESMWPEFRREHLEAAIADFQGRERRFGLTGAQVKT